MNQPCKTPIEDLIKSALEHYEKASAAIHCWNSDIPKAIKYYYSELIKGDTMKGNFNDFADALGQRESGNNYQCENKFGYLGRWQFGKARLYDLGYSIDGWHPSFRRARKYLSKQEFLSNAKLQDEIFREHIKALRIRVYQKFSKYLDKTINYMLITESGCVAGMHLKGEGGLKDFFKGKDNTDALGTKISEYVHKFGNYNLDGKQYSLNNIPIKPIAEIRELKNESVGRL